MKLTLNDSMLRKSLANHPQGSGEVSKEQVVELYRECEKSMGDFVAKMEYLKSLHVQLTLILATMKQDDWMNRYVNDNRNKEKSGNWVSDLFDPEISENTFFGKGK